MRFHVRLALLPLVFFGLWGAALPVLLSGCAPRAEKSAGKFYCPMHPTYVTDHPGDCPICNMKLVPMPETAAPGASSSEASHEGSHGASKEMSHDMNIVELTSDQVELAGVRTAPVTRGALGHNVRAAGMVKSNERLTRTVTLKTSGYIERLLVNTTGAFVHAGDPIVELYSPELLAAQDEFVNARSAYERVKDSSTEGLASAERLLSASRRRLELLDVPAATISKLEAGAPATRTISLTTPWSGFVTTKDVTEGARVEPGTPLYTVTDLSTVWVEASFYESEAGLLRIGRSAEIVPAGAASESAPIVFVAPTVDPATRTLIARFELSNHDLALRPGMFADVLLAGDGGEGPLVPSDAVLDTGTRQIVYVAVGEHRFEPRVVTMGRRDRGLAEILSGLQEGERVVTSATFLLDSESRIRAAASGASTSEGH